MLSWKRVLAQFEGTESALLFSSGYAANVGIISALVGPEDQIFSDEHNHASIIDGCRLSKAKVHVYPHLDLQYLSQRLQEAAAGRKLIITDSLFSMQGDAAPLDKLAEIAEAAGAMLMVDEAHATGIYGKTGRGLAEAMQAEAGVHIKVGTLSKALGSIGGFVAGEQRLIDWLSNRARSYVFSTAAPAAVAAAGSEGLKIVLTQPERRVLLLQRAAHLRTQLKEQGWQVGAGDSQIIPVIIGDPMETMKLSQELQESGYWVPGIRPPSVPAGNSLLRISLCAFHTEEILAEFIDVMRALSQSR